MKDILVIDKCEGSGITGKIIRLIKSISNSIVDIHDISNIYIKSEILPLMNIIFESCKTKPDIELELPAHIQNWALHLHGEPQTTPDIELNDGQREAFSDLKEPIFISNDFEKMCKIAKLIRFNMKHIKYLNTDLYDLSIHLRLTDMNICHGDIYGIVEYEDYEKTISNYLNKATTVLDPVNSIFIATDNLESREKMKNLLDNNISAAIYYNDNNLISLNENNISWVTQQKVNFNYPNSYIEVINDVFNLSNSRTLIYRTSSVSNLAILLSKSLKKQNIILLQ